MVMPMGGFGMGTMTSGNMYDNLNARYGYPPVDHAERPRIGKYPMETVPDDNQPAIRRTRFGRFLAKLFS